MSFSFEELDQDIPGSDARKESNLIRRKNAEKDNIHEGIGRIRKKPSSP
jgi:hypothetical protein